jgi:CheY-like chemotaxis protein
MTGAGENGGDSPTILVVEDELLVRMAVVETLNDCGFNVVEAVSADEAITYLESGGTPDLVFTDVRMPGSMDGFGLSDWLAKNRPGLPVFIASGDIGMANTARQICSHERMFRKPYELKSLVALMREAIEARRSASGA